jgi:hypothetical protein
VTYKKIVYPCQLSVIFLGMEKQTDEQTNGQIKKLCGLILSHA